MMLQVPITKGIEFLMQVGLSLGFLPHNTTGTVTSLVLTVIIITGYQMIQINRRLMGSHLPRQTFLST